MDKIGMFAEEAACFEHCVRNSTRRGDAAARELLVRITRLYLAALDLPARSSPDACSGSSAQRVDDEEWRAVYNSCARLPIDSYGEIFDPFRLPTEPPVVGSIADDVSDIYRDVVGGFRVYEQGHQDEAAWEWSFNFQFHWGEHATSAIRALHRWLAKNSPELLRNAP